MNRRFLYYINLKFFSQTIQFDYFMYNFIEIFVANTYKVS